VVLGVAFEKTISMAVPLFSFLLYSGLTTLSLKSSRSKISAIFQGYLLLMMIWSLSSFMMRTGFFPGPLVWNRLMVLGMVGIPFVFYHFSVEILGQNKSAQLKFGYALFGVFIIGNLLGLVVDDVSLSSGLFTYTLGPLALIFAIAGGGYILNSAILLVKEGINNPKSFWSNRLVYPSVGATLMLVGSVLNLLPEVGKYPVDIFANTINAFLLTYAIYRYRLLNITISIRKGLVYTALTVMLTGSYLFVVYLLESEIRDTTVIIAFIMAAIIAFAFESVKNKLMVRMDKTIFGDKYDYRKTLKELSHLKTSILDLEQLTQSTLDILMKALQIPSSALFLLNKDSNYYMHASINVNPELAQVITIDKTSPIIRRLIRERPILTWKEIETAPDFQGLWEREKEFLQELQTFLLVGIRKQGEVIGILLLPKKTSGDPYSDDDRELLTTLANEVAVSIYNAQIYSEVKRQAILDELTKLYNFRFFHEILDKEIARSKRTHQNFSVIYLDLDFFKAYNDIFGHLAGDDALIRVAQAIINSIRPSDIATRLGGDEFAIILPGADSENAKVVANRIKDTLQRSFPGINSDSVLTISQGIAYFPAHGQQKQQLLSSADWALYQAKNLGRNRVCVYSVSGENGPVEKEGMVAELEKDFLKRQVEDAYLSVIYTLAAAINAKDNYTYRHSEAVTYYSVALADSLGWSEEKKKTVRYAAMLHDIGKIGIPEYILNKPGSLTKEEREIIESHVLVAEAIVSHTPYLREVAPIILHHHESYNGKGYPKGLKGEAIPLESRILTIADAYHAMTSDRPYRKGISTERAVLQMQELAGIQFDPNLLPVFFLILKKESKQDAPGAANAS
jgi:diguanylate cyclase (GGDEF)-like protein/putative nucleotidyltransferase with HDIG domain